MVEIRFLSEMTVFAMKDSKKAIQVNVRISMNVILGFTIVLEISALLIILAVLNAFANMVSAGLIVQTLMSVQGQITAIHKYRFAKIWSDLIDVIVITAIKIHS